MSVLEDDFTVRLSLVNIKIIYRLDGFNRGKLGERALIRLSKLQNRYRFSEDFSTVLINKQIQLKQTKKKTSNRLANLSLSLALSCAGIFTTFLCCIRFFALRKTKVSLKYRKINPYHNGFADFLNHFSGLSSATLKLQLSNFKQSENKINWIITRIIDHRSLVGKKNRKLRELIEVMIGFDCGLFIILFFFFSKHGSNHRYYYHRNIIMVMLMLTIMKATITSRDFDDVYSKKKKNGKRKHSLLMITDDDHHHHHPNQPIKT